MTLFIYLFSLHFEKIQNFVLSLLSTLQKSTLRVHSRRDYNCIIVFNELVNYLCIINALSSNPEGGGQDKMCTNFEIMLT